VVSKLYDRVSHSTPRPSLRTPDEVQSLAQLPKDKPGVERIMAAYVSVGAGKAVGLNDEEIAALSHNTRPGPILRPVEQQRPLPWWALVVVALLPGWSVAFVALLAVAVAFWHQGSVVVGL